MINEVDQRVAELNERNREASRLPSIWLILWMVIETAGTAGGLFYLAHLWGVLP